MSQLDKWIKHDMTFIKEQTSIHTGGGCMIDVFIMNDGKCIAVTDEGVVVGPSLEAIMDDCGDLPCIWLNKMKATNNITELGELL